MTRADGVADGAPAHVSTAEEKNALKIYADAKDGAYEEGICLDLRGGGVSRQAV